MYTFDIGEVFDVAVKIEENGEKFYRELSGTVEDEECASVFSFLADEEVKHKGIFEEMRSKAPKRSTQESYSGEYMSYLREHVSSVVFKRKDLEQEWSDKNDLAGAIEFAIRRELDSILYYHEIKRFVEKHQHNLINEIIAEERKHFIKLKGLKETQLKKM